MRVTRALILLFAVAIAAGGCAQHPVVRYQMVAAPAPQGIDNVVYGSTAVPNYGTAPAPSYGMAPAPTYRVAPAPAYAVAAPGYRTVSPPAYSPPAYNAPAPVYGMAAAPNYTPPATMVRSYPSATMAAPPPVAYAPQIEPTYTLDSGDRLRVVVFGQDGLTNSYVVDASGQIAMPLIGTVSAHGLTTDQLSARIGEALRQGFVREPHVAVEVEAYRPFFILGEVTAPGQYPYSPNMTVETAVAIAGGFGPRALHDPVIVSRNGNGQVFRFQAPITAQIRPGDTVQVKERWF
jgi:polysaccharide biosynthesis/export protein